MSSNFCRILCILSLTLFLIPVQSESQDLSFLADTTKYLWPTDASPYISSTFGETRAAHFHAGLDIRTWGQEGYKVFATRDGIIYRLAISPTGYGKVIFLQHDDGSYSAYAHLNRFEDSLMAFADSIRMKDYSFLFDKNMKDHRIRVSQGDVIGYTGSTGAGPPHLHFELRTPDNEPFNPLLTNLSVDDDIPPVFTGLAVEHLDPQTLHVTDIETTRPDRTGDTFHFGTFTAGNPVGLSVNIHDRANRTPNFYAVYSLALIHKQDTLFHSRVDAYNYKDASQMFVDRVYPLLKERRQGFQRLYLVNGNQLPFYRTGETRGIIDLPNGSHDLKIIAEDFYGNRSTGTLTLNVENRDPRPISLHSGVPAYPKNGSYTSSGTLVPAGRLHMIDIEASMLTAQRTRGPNPEPDSPLRPAIQTEFTASNMVRKKLVPGQRQFLNLPDQTVWLEFPENALFDTLNIEMSVTRRGNLPVITFSPDNIPLKSGVYVNMIFNDDHTLHQQVGIFAYDPRRDSYRFLGSGRPGSVIRTGIRELQELHILYDPAPPYVGRPRIERNLADNYVVNIPVSDALSGIDYLQSRIEVNGNKGITEYDPDKKQLKYYKPGFEPLRKNDIEVRAYDRLGNVTHRKFEQTYQ